MMSSDLADRLEQWLPSLNIENTDKQKISAIVAYIDNYGRWLEAQKAHAHRECRPGRCFCDRPWACYADM